MSTNEELVASLAKLKRGSLFAFPLAVMAFVAIVAMVWFAGRELRYTRGQVAQAQQELDLRKDAIASADADLAQARTELARTLAQNDDAQRSLRAAEQKIETIAVTNPVAAENIAAALVDLAVADASLTLAGAQSATDGGASGSAYGAFSVDVFYCEGQGPQVQEDAARVVALKGSASGRWRTRVLRETVNRGPGYQLSRNEIRYNESEAAVAKSLQADAQTRLGLAFTLVSTDYPTPNYVSAFVCR